MRTTLYGYIEEMEFLKDPIQEQVKNHNSQVIFSLNNQDPWPPLSKEMFHITRNSTNEIPRANLEYSGGIIHFAGNFKSIEHEIEEWIIKFENLLSKLIWIEAKVHFQTEYADLQTLNWYVDLNKYGVENDDKFPKLIHKSNWIFESTWELKKK